MIRHGKGRLFVAVLAVCAAMSASEEASGDTLVIEGGTIIDVRQGQAIADAFVVIEEAQIVAVGPRGSVKIPPDARVVDVSGKWLMPGMIDTHVHFMESGKMAMDMMMRSLDPGLSEAEDTAWLKQRTAFTLSRYLCAGVTTAVSLGGPEHIEFGAREVAESLEIAPRVLIAGGPIGNSGLEWIFDGADAVFAADTEEEIRARVRRFSQLGADAIKLGYLGAEMGVDTDFTPATYAAVMEAATDEAHRLGMPVLTHIMTREAAEAFIDTGLDAYAHLPFDEPVTDEFVAGIVARDIAVAPTIAVFPRMTDVWRERLVTNAIERQCSDPEVIEDYADYAGSLKGSGTMLVAGLGLGFALGNAQPAIAESVRRLHAAGARFIIGSDASHIGTLHGVAMHVEMQMLEDAGLPAATLVQAATINAAEVLGVSAQLGSIESGKLADILVLDADPLQSIRNAQFISSVIRGGRILDHAMLRTDVDESRLMSIHFRQRSIETWVLLEIVCLLAVWLGWKFAPGIGFTRRLARQIHERKMAALETSRPLVAYRGASQQGRTGAAVGILAVLIGLKSLAAFVFGLIMVFWLPFATLLLMPGIVDEHEQRQGGGARRALAGVTVAQVSSHAIAAALGYVLTRWWWASDQALGTLLGQVWPVLGVGLVLSLMVALLAAWLEHRAHVRHGII